MVSTLFFGSSASKPLIEVNWRTTDPPCKVIAVIKPIGPAPLVCTRTRTVCLSGWTTPS